MRFMISPPMMSSGMKTSSHSNLSPSTVIAALASSSTSPGSVPASSMVVTSAIAPSSSIPTMASVSSFDMRTSLNGSLRRPARRLVTVQHIMYRYFAKGKLTGQI